MALQQSAYMGCCFCSSIYYKFCHDRVLQNEAKAKSLVLAQLSKAQNLVQAHLSKVPRQHGLYRLDFGLSASGKSLGTFLLEQTRKEPESQIYTALSKRLDSEEVLQLARFWIRKCLSQDHENCPDANFNNLRTKYWPTRLIELPPHDPPEDDEDPEKTDREKPKKPETVRLVAGKDAAELAAKAERLRSLLPKPPESPSSGPVSKVHARNPAVARGDGSGGADQTMDGATGNITHDDIRIDQTAWQYVTLSHSWGKQQITRLLKETEREFEQGIAMDKLPQTFRDAIKFASRLDPKVRYIWIDSLCIIQDDDEDWAAESVQMYEVYRNSYCNISATAAMNSHEGIYNTTERDTQRLWEEQVNLNIDGIPGARSARRNPNSDIGLEAPIRRCTIQDLSFWDRTVEDAPVNKRAWVLQERLLAPRVLHFCQDQLAWECSTVDAAEALPHGISKMELKSGVVRPRVALKALVSDDYAPRQLAVDKAQASDAAHENWKRIVERYSRTGLTYAKDKLIALAGIAQMMSSSYRRREREHENRYRQYIPASGQITGLYVAGLWERYLASQLLWRVNPVFPGLSDVDTKYEDPKQKHEKASAQDTLASLNAQVKSSTKVPVSNMLGRLPNDTAQMQISYDGYEHTNQANRPSHPSRAPSFSWAAIDAPQGLTLGETVREDELKIAVEKIHVKPKQIQSKSGSGPLQESRSEFGEVAPNGFIELACSLSRISIEIRKDGPRNPFEPNYASYEWDWISDDSRIGGSCTKNRSQKDNGEDKGDQKDSGEGISASNSGKTMDRQESNTNARRKRLPPDVYLDSPKCDFESIRGVKGRLYCVPGREDLESDLTCLLLQRLPDGEERGDMPEFRRVGLTVIPFLESDRKRIMDHFSKRQRIRLY